MAMRTVPDLKELFKQASEIAQQVPVSMQEAAFNRALDLLTGGAEKSDAQAAMSRASQSNTASKIARPPLLGDNATEKLLSQIDSTQHPGVTSAAKILDRALMVLKIALDEHGIDGLAPSAVAKVLTDKFRIRATSTTVGTALSRAPSLVNRVPGNGGFVYRIMAPGEAYLSNLANPAASLAGPTVRSVNKKSPRAGRKRATVTSVDKDAKPVSAKKAGRASTVAKRTSKTLGPKAAVLSLLAENFFDAPKTGQAVQAHLRTKRGFTIDTTQLRVALLRLVREQALDREANSDGDYEYKRR
jgi:hypothetical protein